MGAHVVEHTIGPPDALENRPPNGATTDREVLLHLLALFAAEGRIGHYHLVAILLLDVSEVLRKRVGMDDVGRLDAMQDHIHDRDDIG